MARIRGPGSRLILAVAMFCLGPRLLAEDRLPPVPGAPVAIDADPVGEGLRIYVDRFELEPVTAAELAGGSALPQSSSRMRAIAAGGSLHAEGGLQVPPLPATIERELPAVWEFRRRRGASPAIVPRVRVEIEKSAASAGGTHAQPPLQVRASQVSRRDEGNGTEVFVGGVILVIPIGALQTPGLLRARLRITVESF
jgi:hypothetical protein